MDSNKCFLNIQLPKNKKSKPQLRNPAKYSQNFITKSILIKFLIGWTFRNVIFMKTRLIYRIESAENKIRKI